MINIFLAFVLSWIKKEHIFEYIYQSTCKMKQNIANYILFQFTWGRILNHPWITILVSKKVAFLVFLYWCYLTILLFESLKKYTYNNIILHFKPEDLELSFIKWNWSCVLSPSVSNYPVITLSSLYSSFNVSSIIRSIPTIPVTKWQFLFLTNTKVSKVFPNKNGRSHTKLFLITSIFFWNYIHLTMKKDKM